MRQFVMAAMLLLFAGRAAAQDQTPRHDAGRRSRFGAPVLRYTVVGDQGAVMFGGRGGLNLTPSLLLGAGTYATMSEVDAPEGAATSASGPLDLKFESFGFDLEYAVDPAAPTHLTVTTFMGGAAARYAKDKTDEQWGESDFMLLFEPAVGVEQSVTDWLHLNLGVSYRLVSGVEQAGLQDGDLKGAAAALAAKLGRF